MSKEEYFAKTHAQLTVWQQKLDNLESSMQGAKESSSDTLDDLKNRIQSSLDELKSGFDAAWQRMRQ